MTALAQHPGRRRRPDVVAVELVLLTGTLVLALVVAMLLAAPVVLPLAAASAAAWVVVGALAYAGRRDRPVGRVRPRTGPRELDRLLVSRRPR